MLPNNIKTSFAGSLLVLMYSFSLEIKLFLFLFGSFMCGFKFFFILCRNAGKRSQDGDQNDDKSVRHFVLSDFNFLQFDHQRIVPFFVVVYPMCPHDINFQAPIRVPETGGRVHIFLIFQDFPVVTKD